MTAHSGVISIATVLDIASMTAERLPHAGMSQLDRLMIKCNSVLLFGGKSGAYFYLITRHLTSFGANL